MSLDTSYVKDLVENYANNQWQFINAQFAQDGIKDARCAWFSIADLQNFINEVQKPNPTGTVATGIRIYFGAHSITAPHPTNDYNRLHNVVLLPTFSAKDGKNYDFDATTGTSDFANLATVSALDHSSLIPPPYPVAGPDNMYDQGNLFMKYADNQ